MDAGIEGVVGSPFSTFLPAADWWFNVMGRII
jgi:hypothetical protein